MIGAGGRRRPRAEVAAHASTPGRAGRPRRDETRPRYGGPAGGIDRDGRGRARMHRPRLREQCMHVHITGAGIWPRIDRKLVCTLVVFGWTHTNVYAQVRTYPRSMEHYFVCSVHPPSVCVAARRCPAGLRAAARRPHTL